MKLLVLVLVAVFLLSLVEVNVEAFFRSRPLGPSGKPMQHFIPKNNRKEAQQAAQQQGGGRPPVHHNEQGQKSHFHPADKNGNIQKDGSHFQYGPKKNG